MIFSFFEGLASLILKISFIIFHLIIKQELERFSPSSLFTEMRDAGSFVVVVVVVLMEL